MSDTDSNCSFCERSFEEVGPFVKGKPQEGGDQARVCRFCIQQMSQFLDSAHDEDTGDDRPIAEIIGEMPSAKELIAELDEHVIGQSSAKKVLAVAVVNHYKRILQDESTSKWLKPYEDVTIDKSNVLLIGPTGCGKTELARTLARRMGVPFAIGDATTLTEAGYVGEDVENLLLKLLYAADFDLKLAEHGIIYIDEIDKIGRTNNNVSITRDVSGEGVQQSLLKMLEGTVANVPPGGGRKHPEQQYIRMDTTNILFICGGTFVGLEEIIAKRINRSKIGFGRGADPEQTDEDRSREIMSQLTTRDLTEFGLIPELIGRLPVACPLHELGDADLVRVLTEPKNSIVKQYQKIFAFDKTFLRFETDALFEIARQAKELKTGARALRSIIEGLLLDVQADLSNFYEGTSVVITPGFVRGEEPLFTKAEAA